MNRHTAREVALKMIFQMDVGKNLPHMAELTLAEAQLPQELSAFASELAFRAFEMKDELDARISGYLAADWTMARLANVDKNILRLALYELLYYPEIPIAVSLDEAIELAKVYGGAEASAFVNGLLDKLVKNETIEKTEAAKKVKAAKKSELCKPEKGQ